MYEPILNSVLVEIDDADAKWGRGNDDAMLGKSYSKGRVIEVATFAQEESHPFIDRSEAESIFEKVYSLKGKKIIWNEGHEAGTTFDFDGKQFAMIYWWDIRGVLVET